ncbi:unnamed protein product, partial [Adineta steineri]
MAMLVNPNLYSHVQQQVLSNPNFLQAYQHMFADNAPPKVASETQVVPSTNPTLDNSIKQTIAASRVTKEQQQQNLSSSRSRPVLTQATKPIQLTSLESDFDNEQQQQQIKSRTRFTSSETALTENQQQDIALTQ